MAHEESIAAELMAAEVAAIRNSGGKGRPGWLEGTLTTVRWAWGGSTKAPLEMPSTDTA
jgi:hypothetical protein